MMRGAVTLALALGAVGCAPAPLPTGGFYGTSARTARGNEAATLAPVTGLEWRVARARLARMRAATPSRPFVERIRIAIVDPRTGRAYEARGALAISPNQAARLLLLGPGGATALDVWVTKDRFRFAVPAMRFQKRGGADPNEAVGLPIGLLRWWFLSPLGGRLLVGRASPEESAWLLRDGPATITVRTDGSRVAAIRREGDRYEGIEWIGAGVLPRAGARGRYVEDRFGLRVDVLVEEVLTAEPDPAAFLDPDERGTEL